MPLPTSDLKLFDVADALDMSLTNISMYNVINHFAVNGDGLNPTYCPGATGAARLTNLRTTPYVLGKFRGYDHSAGGSLNAITVSTTNAISPCNTLSIATTVYSTQTTIALAYGNDQEIYSDSGGTTFANSGWYTEDDTNWFYWDSSSGRWDNYTVCNNVIQIYAIGPYASQLGACISADKEDDYYFEPIGSNSVPVTGDTVYTDSNLTYLASPGYYKVVTSIDWFQVGSNGIVVNNGKC